MQKNKRSKELHARPDHSAADDDIFAVLDTAADLNGMLLNEKNLVKADMPEGRMITAKESKKKFRHVSRKEKAEDLMETLELPGPNETIHVISNAQYDYFNVIMAAARRNAPILEFYGSTWTMSKFNVDDLITAMDQGTIRKVSILTGTYFKARESSVYAQLITALAKHNQRYTAFINHTKIALLKAENGSHIVFEGSPNFTHNPRLENYIICNSQELYEFHRDWMESRFK